MLKTAFAALALVTSLGAPAFASHPHQSVCVVHATLPDKSEIQFLFQVESSREYASGDPNKDVQDFRYQVRVCDDDNDDSQCSTYESKAVTHSATDEVTLVGMKNKKAVFFRGHIEPNRGMDGQIISSDGTKKSLVPFKATLDACIGQSWVKLAREAASNAY